MRCSRSDRPATALSSLLSPREEAVLRLASQGLSDRSIAAELDLTTPTVRTYWCRIREKLGAKNRTQAVALCVRELDPGAASLALADAPVPYREVRGIAALLDAEAWVVERPEGALHYLTGGCANLLGGDARAVSCQAGGWRGGLCPPIRHQLEDAERELDRNRRCAVCAGVVWRRSRGRNHPTLLVRVHPLGSDYAVLVLLRSATIPDAIAALGAL